jgi:hypothetical protein
MNSVLTSELTQPLQCRDQPNNAVQKNKALSCENIQRRSVDKTRSPSTFKQVLLMENH